MFELTDLQVFKAVVEGNGITAAAKQLHRVPSNVTTRIKKLEESLGMKLFTRDRNRLQLTPTGQRLLHYADQLLSLSQRALEDLSSDAPTGQLNIGSMESSAAARLPEVLVAFHQRFSAVQIELTTGASGPLGERVLKGELDVAFIADPPRDDRLVAVPLFAEELVVVKPPSLSESSGPADLPTPLTVVGFTQGCSYRDRIEQWLEEGQRRPDRVIEIPSYHTMLSCVLAGMGIALVPRSVLRLDSAHQGLALEEPREAISHATTHLIWREDSQTSAILALLDVARQFTQLAKIPNHDRAK